MALAPRIALVGARADRLERLRASSPHPIEPFEETSRAFDVLVVDVAQSSRSLAQWRAIAPGPVVVIDETCSQTVLDWVRAGADAFLTWASLETFPAVLAQLEHQGHARALNAVTEQAWREGTAALFRVSGDASLHQVNLVEAAKRLNTLATQVLQVARSAIWLFEEGCTQIRLLDAFDARDGSHFSGVVAPADPAIGCALPVLEVQRTAGVSDVHADARTRLALNHYGPMGIGATLDTGVSLQGTLVGKLCLEHVGGTRTWTAVDEGLATAIADLMALCIEGRERRRAEQALALIKRGSAEVFRHSNDSIIIYGVQPDGSVVCDDLNPAAEALTGFTRDQLVGRSMTSSLQTPLLSIVGANWQQVIQTRAPMTYERELPLPAGTRWVNTALVPMFDETGAVARIAAISRDVTRVRQSESLQRNLEAQVAEAQKNEALARLASHIAHDVNNLLSVVVAHAQRLQDGQARPSEVAQAILETTTRGRELTQQVLTFGRRRPPERKPLELGPVVHEALRLLGPTAPNVTVRERLEARLPRVLADKSQLHQVLTNLCTNAVQALPPTGGTVTVSVETVELDFDFATRHPPLQAGRWVRVSVEDTGQGMDSQTATRIFEPFFSTRRSGSGTGLGLAVVQSIVQAHDGAVLVETKLTQGSRFSVFLPPLMEEPARPGAGQHLLLVDDHPGMARVSARLLETLGYRTTVFDDPRDALAAFTAAPESFDAVLTDLSMPQMTGEDFIVALRSVRAGLPIVVSSGLASELDDSLRRRLNVDAVLIKPWRLEEAVTVLQRVLR